MGFDAIDWKSNKIFESPNDFNHRSDGVLAFFPTSIDLAHIYQRLLPNYNAPKPVNRKYDSPYIEVYDGKDVKMRMEDPDNRYGFWSSRDTLFDKRQHRKHSWDAVVEFVEKNQHILNKIEELSV